MDLDKCIKARCSCKNFKTKKPDYRKIIDALDLARLAPFAGNIQTIKFILVQDKNKIKQLANACQQSFVGTVHYIVVVTSDSKMIKKSFEERSNKYCRQQAGAVIQNFLLKLEDLGLASCWIGHFVDDQVKRILEIPEDVEVEALFPIGYAMKKGKQRRKQDLDKSLFFDKYKNKFMRPKDSPEGF